VVERRARKLPKPPASPMVDERERGGGGGGGGGGSGMATPLRNSAASSSSLSTPRQSAKVLRSYLRGDTPKRDTQQRVAEALECVETNQLDRLNDLLDTGRVDANATDGDGNTLLDLAVMLNHAACVRLLQLYGGVETEACVFVRGLCTEGPGPMSRGTAVSPLTPPIPPKNPCRH
jgi:hypothetical protein